MHLKLNWGIDSIPKVTLRLSSILFKLIFIIPFCFFVGVVTDFGYNLILFPSPEDLAYTAMNSHLDALCNDIVLGEFIREGFE